jgi:uncharacterized protein YaaR (DUF327 family)
MTGPGPVDGSSPFFASIAGQAALREQSSRTKEGKKAGSAGGLTKFDRLLKERTVADSALEETRDAFIPAHLAGLPPEKILEALLDEVHSAGDALKEKPLPDNISAYKDAVRHFVRYVVDRTYSVSVSTSGGNILKRKKFTQVQVIDQKLEQMAAGILSNQRGQLSLLEKIEEINGLLVDLLS